MMVTRERLSPVFMSTKVTVLGSGCTYDSEVFIIGLGKVLNGMTMFYDIYYFFKSNMSGSEGEQEEVVPPKLLNHDIIKENLS